MTNPFSPLEIQLIRSSLTTKFDSEIAEMLERPIDEVIAKIIELTGVSSEERTRDVNQYRLELARVKPKRRAPQPKKVKAKPQEDKQRIQVEKDWAQQRADTQKREMKRTYKTREVDMSTLVSVKLDSKTYAFVKPGTDIERVKADYQQLKIKRQSYNEKTETT